MPARPRPQPGPSRLPPAIGFAEALSKVGLVVSFAALERRDERAGRACSSPTTRRSRAGATRTPARAFARSGPADAPPDPRHAAARRHAPRDRSRHGRRASRSAAAGRQLQERARGRTGPGTNWRQALANGGEFGDHPDARRQRSPARAGNVRPSAPKLAGSGAFTLVAFPHSYIGDGTGAALPWLQEIPDPVTKLSWNSWAEISHAKADEMGLSFGDVISVETPGGSVELSVYPRGGIRDDVIAIPIGSGSHGRPLRLAHGRRVRRAADRQGRDGSAA